ncbi:MAG: pilus (MSHA type) biogenesis protein MshL [Gammaproteobacteria bacterium]|nr:pilus (MSHA type) biogenesis protein MshL [Gammaproteobacteria bacterium]
MVLRNAGFVMGGLAMLAVALSACTVPPPQPREISEGHLSTGQPAPPPEIPEPVRQSPYLPPPAPEPPAETYTVVVSDVPVRELLFALARDAAVNVDVHPDIEGQVTLNAVEQSLFQILDRISRQLAVRYEERDGTIVVLPDAPFLRTYKVDYVNVSRDSSGQIGASTLVASSGEGGGAGDQNTSNMTISNTSNNRFWETLQTNVEAIVSGAGAATSGAGGNVILNRESGLMLVRATAAQHDQVTDYLQQVAASVSRQVLIEATIVEVQLNDRYQGGIDWRIFAREGGAAGLVLGSDLGAAFTGGLSAGVAGLILSGSDSPDPERRNFQATINLLNEFGDTQVLSSPKVMTLNNQPALLKVVDNEVYFEIEVETTQTQTNALTTIDTDARTVSVGLVMSVTPQIAESDSVTLNVRPTITRVREFVDDPGVPIALAQIAAGGVVIPDVANRVPVVQVRETETVMRVSSGQMAVLGGLMQDRLVKDDEAVPGVSEADGVGELFKFREREQSKTELVIFLRPTIIRIPDIERDLSNFRRYLPENLQNQEMLPAPAKPLYNQSQ